MSDSRIRIKMGEIEVEYEGTESFLRDELPALLAAVSKLHNQSDASAVDGKRKKKPDDDSRSDLQGTTATIAAKLKCGVGAGKELITAAAARLTFVLHKDSFTRTELLLEARTATSYYKTSVSNNLSATLIALVKSGHFTEVAQDTYALSATRKEELRQSLAA